jgi:hypothetical protein
MAARPGNKRRQQNHIPSPLTTQSSLIFLPLQLPGLTASMAAKSEGKFAAS